MNLYAVPPIWTWSPAGWVFFLILCAAILLIVAFVMKDSSHN
jgi:hypothetical protein